MDDEQVWSHIQRCDAFTSAELSGDESSAVAVFRLGEQYGRREAREQARLALTELAEGLEDDDNPDEPFMVLPPLPPRFEPVVIAKGEVLAAWGPGHFVRAAQFNYPEGGPMGYWRSSCSCGKYLSSWFRQRRAAEAAGLAHGAKASQHLGEEPRRAQTR